MPFKVSNAVQAFLQQIKPNQNKVLKLFSFRKSLLISSSSSIDQTHHNKNVLKQSAYYKNSIYFGTDQFSMATSTNNLLESNSPVQQYYKQLTYAISHPDLHSVNHNHIYSNKLINIMEWIREVQGVNKRLNEANSLILDKLEAGEYEIKQKSLHLQQAEPINNHSAVESTARIKEIMAKKQKMRRELEQLQKQEENLKQLRHFTESAQKAPAIKQRSEFTKQDGKMLKKMAERLRKFEEELQKKTQQINQNIQSMKKGETEQQAERLKQNTAQREHILKRIEEIKRQQEERKQWFMERERQLTQAKAKSKLYEAYQKRFKEKEEIEKQEKEKIHSMLKKQKVTDYDDIKEHAKKYDQIIKKQKQQRESRMGLTREPNSSQYYHNRLFNVISEEQALQRELERQKSEKARELAQKRARYAEVVKMEHMPKINKNSAKDLHLFEASTSRNDAIKPLTFAEIVKQGNQNLKESKSLIKKQDPQTAPNRTSTQSSPPKPFKYENYLTHKNLHKSKSELDIIKEIVQKENQPNHEKFRQAKLVVDKMNNKSGSSNQQIIKSINAKLEILKKMYE